MSGHIAGLLGPGDRKSIQPMAARDDGVSQDRLHPFTASGVWDEKPLEVALLTEAYRQIGDDEAWLISDDTALPKKRLPFGWCNAVISLGAWQERQLLDVGVDNAGIGRSSNHGRLPPVPSHELGQRCGLHGPRWSSRRLSRLQKRSRWPRSTGFAQAVFASAAFLRMQSSNQKMTVATMRMANMNWWAHRS